MFNFLNMDLTMFACHVSGFHNGMFACLSWSWISQCLHVFLGHGFHGFHTGMLLAMGLTVFACHFVMGSMMFGQGVHNVCMTCSPWL